MKLGSEKVRRILSSFGLTEKETEVYIFLARHGVIRGGEIIKGLRMHRADVYRLLKSLLTKGLVEATLESPARFSIVPFESVLESFIKAKHNEAVSIENARQDLLEDWKIIRKPIIDVPLEKFTVFEGSSKILGKIQQMVGETKHRLSMTTSVTGLVRADQFGVFDSITNRLSDSQVEYRILADVSNQNLRAVKAIMKRTGKMGLRFRTRNPAFRLQLPLNMVIRDSEEILFFITPAALNGDTNPPDTVCLFTNCNALVQSFNNVFEDLWQNAAGIESMIAETVTGSLSPKVRLIKDSKTAKRKHEEALRLAKEQVLMTTSIDGLISLRRNSRQLNDWAKRNVSVRIMAPITGENLAVALNLPECCEVRHISGSETMITVVDGQTLFQFCNPVPSQAKQSMDCGFDQVFYTDDPAYIEKARMMLDGLWRSSHSPSAATLSAILGGDTLALGPISEKTAIEDERFAGIFCIRNELPKLTEKAVLGKMLSGKKYLLSNFEKEGMVNYGSCARAVIHPPEHFDLPDLMIEAIHYDKQSSIGQEDALRVYSRPKASGSGKFSLAAVVTDSAVAAEARKIYCPACNNVETIQLVKENELQVRIFGNTLFAGWTVPIPLGSSRYVLPPACILYEGFGEIRAKRNIVRTLDGQTQIWEIDDYEAFVTFFHPASKYAGPGTDGEFARDCIVTTLPPLTVQK